VVEAVGVLIQRCATEGPAVRAEAVRHIRQMAVQQWAVPEQRGRATTEAAVFVADQTTLEAAAVAAEGLAMTAQLAQKKAATAEPGTRARYQDHRSRMRAAAVAVALTVPLGWVPLAAATAVAEIRTVLRQRLIRDLAAAVLAAVLCQAAAEAGLAL